MAKSKLEFKLDGFNVQLTGGDLNGNCKTCGAMATLEYQGLDFVHPDFRIVCNRRKTYTLLKIRMLPKYELGDRARASQKNPRWLPICRVIREQVS